MPLVRRAFLCGCLGAALGPGTDLVRPLLRRFPVTAQLLISLQIAACWLYGGFAVCDGDLRYGYLLSGALGYLLWRWAVRDAFAALSRRFFREIRRLGRGITGPFRLILKKFTNLQKISLHSGKNRLQ